MLILQRACTKTIRSYRISADRCNFSCALGQVQNLKKDKMNEKNIYDFTNHGTFSLFL
ncbi:hypothetical protein LEP1GSC108_0792 [Leptospira weilii str. UI 13098]|uniref:Uncharacterized protein n=1 Tax=Leptospira weilii str. UI 13098 TaxID=1088542 RepID=M6QG83_9LEPT|nr:hypothetical protein LEP1GSC108_0792 [Leptospira weilii str. UI 13098]